MSNEIIRGPDYVLEWIKHRLKLNKAWIGVVVGPLGIGKTYFAISKAEELSKMLGVPFSANNICLDQEQFVDAINDPELLSQVGTSLVFDEVGVSWSSRTWMNRLQNWMNFYLQTSRHRNNVLWFTTPAFGFLDSQARILCNCIYEMQGINQRTKTSHAKPFMIQYNQRSGKTYNKYLEVNHKEYGNLSFTDMVAKLPSQEIIDAYEKKKRIFTDKIAAEMKAQFMKQKEGQLPKIQQQAGDKVALSPREEQVYCDAIEGMSMKESATKRGITEGTIHGIRSKVRLKGWNIQKIKQKRG